MVVTIIVDPQLFWNELLNKSVNVSSFFDTFQIDQSKLLDIKDAELLEQQEQLLSAHQEKMTRLQETLQLLCEKEEERLSVETKDRLQLEQILHSNDQQANKDATMARTLGRTIEAQIDMANYSAPLDDPKFFERMNLLKPLIASESSSLTLPQISRSKLAPKATSSIALNSSEPREGCDRRKSLVEDFDLSTIRDTRRMIHECSHSDQLTINRKPVPSLITKRKVQPTPEEEPVNPFVVEPNAIHFKEYRVGESYELEFKFRNVSKHSRRIRLILDPVTGKQNFLCEPKYFPGEYGKIPNGLCCTFAVRFNPTSYRPCEHQVIVVGDLGESIIIPVKAQLARPDFELKVKEGHTDQFEIDIGSYRSGYKFGRQVRLLNKGAHGFARILDASKLDNHLASIGSQRPTDVEDLESSLNLEPFKIHPVHFEASENGRIEIDITIQAPELSDTFHQRFSRQIALVYDNFEYQLIDILCEVQKPHFEVFAIDDEKIGFFPSADLNLAVDFGETVRHETIKKRIKMTNRSNLKFPFKWVSNSTLKTASNGKASAHQLFRRPFTASPSSGIFKANQTITFDFSFHPLLLGRSDELFFMELESSDPVRKQVRDKVGHLRLHGSTVASTLAFDPFAPNFPPQLFLGEKSFVEFSIINTNAYPISFDATCQLPFDGIQAHCVPSQGDLEPQQRQTIRIHLEGIFISDGGGEVQIRLHDDTIFSFPIASRVDYAPNVLRTSLGVINFGVIERGKQYHRTLEVENTCRCLLYYKISVAQDQDDILFSPSRGCLHPHSKAKIQFTCCSNAVGDLDYMFYLCASTFENGPFTPVGLFKAQTLCQLPSATLANTDIDFGQCYEMVESKTQLILQNPTMLAVSYKCKAVKEEGMQMELEPSSGEIPPESCSIVTATLVSSNIGEFCEIPIVVYVKGMTDGDLMAHARGIVSPFSFKHEILPFIQTSIQNPKTTEIEKIITQYPSSSEKIDFGKHCPIFARRTRTIRLVNTSGIRMSFQIKFDRFGFCKLENSKKENTEVGLHSIFHGGREIGFKSDQGRRYAKTRSNWAAFIDENREHLHENHGIVFYCSQSNGVLEPFQNIDIEVTAVNDMWGTFQDTMHIQFEDPRVLPLVFPVDIQVVGSPIRFHEFPTIPDPDSLGLNMHYTLVSTDPSSNYPLTENQKILHIINLSPRPLGIEWKTQILEQKQDPPRIRCNLDFHAVPTTGRIHIAFRTDPRRDTRDGTPFDVHPKLSIVEPRSRVPITVTMRCDAESKFRGMLFGHLAEIQHGRLNWVQPIPTTHYEKTKEENDSTPSAATRTPAPITAPIAGTPTNIDETTRLIAAETSTATSETPLPLDGTPSPTMEGPSASTLEPKNSSIPKNAVDLFDRPMQAGPILLPLHGQTVRPQFHIENGKNIIVLKCRTSNREVMESSKKEMILWRRSVGIGHNLPIHVRFRVRLSTGSLEDIKEDGGRFVIMNVNGVTPMKEEMSLNPGTMVFVTLAWVTNQEPTVAYETTLEIQFCNGEVQRFPVKLEIP